MTLLELRVMLSDPRCPLDAEIKVRVVDTQNDDGPLNSYRAMEIPLGIGFTGWEDGHWSILAYGPVSEDVKQ